MKMQILSISQINNYIAGKLDSDPALLQVAVRGEISNYKLYPSGHHYFSLKDENSCLKCVMFRGSAVRLRFRPENGMKVIAIGKIAVYLRDGVYQMSCTTMTPDGIGDMYAAFEQLKKELAAEGLFDPVHKKKLPQYPRVIGVVTSAAGAAIHDILRILNKRYPLAAVRLLPVRVQGAEAPQEICAAIRYANKYRLAELLIVGRGGGSVEDLWAFNDRAVARAIYDSEIPVISAVGHEPDVTISDYVADLRAATPSNAAELAVPDQLALRQRLDDLYFRLNKLTIAQINTCADRLKRLSHSPELIRPTGYLEARRMRVEQLSGRLTAAESLQLQRKRQLYTACAAKLDAMSPLKVISRGYAIVSLESGEVVRSSRQVSTGDTIDIRLSEGRIQASVMNKDNREDAP